MGRQEKREIRMPQNLWDSLYDVASRVFSGRSDERGDRSALVREASGQMVNSWKHSPYVCTRGRFFVFVNRVGDLFYRAEEVLHLNSARQLLPCSLVQKLEKQEYYLRVRPVDAPDQDDWLRQRWLFNHFSVWDGLNMTSSPLAKHVDDFGIFRKAADLPISRPEGSTLTREMMLGLTDYSQWREDDRQTLAQGRDRSGVLISIPMTELSFVAMIDEALFDGIRREDWNLPALRMELRNGENGRFSDLAANEIKSSGERPCELTMGCSSDDHHRHSRSTLQFEGSRCRKLLAQFRERVGEIGLGKTEEVHSRQGILRRMREPEDFLYCQVKWFLPPVGVDVCISWEKVPKRFVMT